MARRPHPPAPSQAQPKSRTRTQCPAGRLRSQDVGRIPPLRARDMRRPRTRRQARARVFLDQVGDPAVKPERAVGDRPRPHPQATADEKGGARLPALPGAEQAAKRLRRACCAMPMRASGGRRARTCGSWSSSIIDHLPNIHACIGPEEPPGRRRSSPTAAHAAASRRNRAGAGWPAQGAGDRHAR